MDSDLIPAVCPNCGGKLNVDPSVDTLVCQFCGTEHLIRRNASGDIALEAFARCPLCKRNDQVEKVTAILHKQTRQSDGFISQQQVYKDAQGITRTRTVNVPIQSVQTSELARKLSPPPPPSIKPTSKPVVLLLILAIIAALIGLCVLLFELVGVYNLVSAPHLNSEKLLTTILFAVLGGCLPLLLSVGMSILWYYLHKKERERQKQEQSVIYAAYQRWQQARARWDKLYYCGRDDIIFIPGEKTSAVVANMMAYVTATPGK